MNPYDISIKKLKESKSIKNEVKGLKMNLVMSFLKVTSKMESDEIMELTGLDKADLSRIRALSVARFTIDKMIKLLDSLGYSTQIKVVSKKIA